jgi:hypothetical protein
MDVVTGEEEVCRGNTKNAMAIPQKRNKIMVPAIQMRREDIVGFIHIPARFSRRYYI